MSLSLAWDCVIQAGLEFEILLPQLPRAGILGTWSPILSIPLSVMECAPSCVTVTTIYLQTRLSFITDTPA